MNIGSSALVRYACLRRPPAGSESAESGARTGFETASLRVQAMTRRRFLRGLRWQLPWSLGIRSERRISVPVTMGGKTINIFRLLICADASPEQATT